jgi:hypothetical protein
MQKRRRLKRCVCPVDLNHVNHAALSRSHELIPAILPRGMTCRTQYVVPSRDKRRLVSIFLDSGKWGDFAILAHGDDLVGLIAHVFNVSHRDAARLIAHFLGIEWRTAPDVGDTTEDR